MLALKQEMRGTMQRLPHNIKSKSNKSGEEESSALETWHLMEMQDNLPLRRKIMQHLSEMKRFIRVISGKQKGGFMSDYWVTDAASSFNMIPGVWPDRQVSLFSIIHVCRAVSLLWIPVNKWNYYCSVLGRNRASLKSFLFWDEQYGISCLFLLSQTLSIIKTTHLHLWGNIAARIIFW